jgi:hypothetical protein
MGTKHVIAYALHETERNAAERLLKNAQVTDATSSATSMKTASRNSSGPVWSSTRWPRPAGQRPRPWREAPCRHGGASRGGDPATTTRYRRRRLECQRNGW